MRNDLGQLAKEWLQDFVPKIDLKLEEIWNTEELDLVGYNKRQQEIAKDMIIHSRLHNLAPSKRIRAAFVYNGFRLGSTIKVPIPLGIWKAACAIELVHTALLMHDDFMDEDLLRRGNETTNAHYAKEYGKHYGDVMAVNLGDMTLSLGYEILLKCGLPAEKVIAANQHLQRTIFKTSIGQAFDVSLEHIKNWSEEDVLAVHKAKTSFYTYENPLLVGAILGNLQNNAIDILREYSEFGGIAFQLQDDILGVFGESKNTGKSSDSDLLQGKATLLVLKSMDRPEVQEVWGRKTATSKQLDAAKKAIRESGSLDYSRNLAKKFALESANSAEKLRKLNLNSEVIDFLQGIAVYMVEREV